MSSQSNVARTSIHPRSSRIEFRRLSYGIGAEVFGVDMRDALDSDSIAELRRAWLDHGILLFRDQDMTPEQHVAFTRQFGELLIHPIAAYRHPDYPELFLVANFDKDGKPAVTKGVAPQFHSDLAYTLEPSMGSMLHCKEIPSIGGTTAFTNMYMAYDRLSDTMKGVIESLWAVRDVTRVKNFHKKDPALQAKMRADFPAVSQPVVKVHPETGRKALYIQQNSPCIDGMTEEESRPLIDFLCAHATQPEFVYRHFWRPNDVIWWDNRCTMHLAVADFDQSERRTMFRTTLRGEPSGRLYQG